MSLKNLEVHNLLAKHFVCAWRNTEGDPDAGESNRHPCGSQAVELRRGIGKANVQTLVLTPDGRIIHAVSGYIGARDLLWELENALHTWHQLRGIEGLDTARTIVRKRIHEINKGEADERELLQGKRKADSDPVTIRRKGRLLSSWAQAVVRTDRAFVSEHPLMPIEDFRTRMLTGGHAGRFGYRVSNSAQREPKPGSISQTEFQKLPRALRKSFMKHVPEAFHGDPTMVSIQNLPKDLRKKIAKRVQRMRRIAAKQASRRR